MATGRLWILEFVLSEQHIWPARWISPASLNPVSCVWSSSLNVLRIWLVFLPQASGSCILKPRCCLQDDQENQTLVKHHGGPAPYPQPLWNERDIRSRVWRMWRLSLVAFLVTYLVLWPSQRSFSLYFMLTRNIKSKVVGTAESSHPENALNLHEVWWLHAPDLCTLFIQRDYRRFLLSYMF